MRPFFLAALMALLIGVRPPVLLPRRLVRARLSGQDRGGSHSFDLLRWPARVQLVMDQGPDTQ